MAWKPIQNGGEFGEVRQWQNEATGEIASGETPPATISTAQGPNDKWIAGWQTQPMTQDGVVAQVPGWHNVTTGGFSETKPGQGEILKTINNDVREESLGIVGGLYKGKDGYYSAAPYGGSLDVRNAEGERFKKLDNITDANIPGILAGTELRQKQDEESSNAEMRQAIMAVGLVLGAGAAANAGLFGGAGLSTDAAMANLANVGGMGSGSELVGSAIGAGEFAGGAGSAASFGGAAGLEAAGLGGAAAAGALPAVAGTSGGVTAAGLGAATEGSELVGNAIGSGELTGQAALETAGLTGAEAAGASGMGGAGTGITAADIAAGTGGAGAAGTAAGTAGAAGGAAAGTTAATTAGTVAAATTAKDVITAAKDIGTLAAVVTSVNTLLDDPLNLNGDADQAADAATDASKASAESQRQLAQIAKEQWEFYKTNYQPLEKNLIKQAMEAGSPEEFARARGAANADVTGAYDAAKKNTERRMQSYGLNPAAPAYQSGMASADLAQGASTAGALTTADNNTRNLAYSKGLDVVGIGRNIPAQSAASSAAAANAATNAASVNDRRQVTQNAQGVQNTQALGYGLDRLGSVAQRWFGGPSTPTYDTGGYSGSQWSDGVDGFAEGGPVIDAEKTGDGSYDATGLKTVMMKHGLSESNAHQQAHSAAKRVFAPHIKVFASGGGVGRQGAPMPDMSNMGLDANRMVQGPGTGTSDSIPTTIDGEDPAALSDGEFVINSEVPKMTGEEILTAINQAGLQKRGQAPATSNDVSINAGAQAYARGGKVKRFACAGL